MSPRLSFTGPILKNKLSFSESFNYLLVKQPVRGLPWPRNETKSEGFTSFTNFQYVVSPSHLLTANVNVFPCAASSPTSTPSSPSPPPPIMASTVIPSA